MTSLPPPLGGAIDWLTGVAHRTAHWFAWAFTMQHLAQVVLVGTPVLVLLVTLRAWHLRWLLKSRQSWAVIPTERYTRRLSDDLVTNVGKILSQVRRRAVGLGWWMRPASAIRFRLDSINYGGTIYSMSGPAWAREVLETTGYTGVILCPMSALDLSRLTPKGLYVASGEPLYPDARTRPARPPTRGGS